MGVLETMTTTLERAQRVCEAATAGPWEHQRQTHPERRNEVHWILNDNNESVCTMGKYKETDATFIALSRTLLPQLIEVALAALKFREDDHVDTCGTGWGDPCDCIMPDLRTALRLSQQVIQFEGVK